MTRAQYIIRPKNKDDFVKLRIGVDFRGDRPWFHALKERPAPIDMDVPMDAMILYLPDKRRKK